MRRELSHQHGLLRQGITQWGTGKSVGGCQLPNYPIDSLSPDKLETQVPDAQHKSIMRLRRCFAQTGSSPLDVGRWQGASAAADDERGRLLPTGKRALPGSLQCFQNATKAAEHNRQGGPMSRPRSFDPHSGLESGLLPLNISLG